MNTCGRQDKMNISAFPPVPHDWVIKGLGMSSRVCATGHIKDPLPLIVKRRGLSPGGRFPPSFNHQVIITGLNKLRLYGLPLKMASDAPLQLRLKTRCGTTPPPLSQGCVNSPSASTLDIVTPLR